MPLYEYKCPSCGTRFEELVSVNASERVVCPHCGEPKPVRQLSTFACCGDSDSGSSASSNCGSRGGFS